MYSQGTKNLPAKARSARPAPFLTANQRLPPRASVPSTSDHSTPAADPSSEAALFRMGFPGVTPSLGEQLRTERSQSMASEDRKTL